MNQESRTKILDIPIDRLNFDEAVKKIGYLVEFGGQHQVATVNPEFIMHSLKNTDFKEALLNSALNTPDGIGMLWAARYLKLKSKNRFKNAFWLFASLSAILFNRKWLSTELPERVSGVDLVWAISQKAEEKDWSIFLLGGRDGVAEKTAERLKKYLPNLKIVGIYEGSPEDPEVVKKVSEAKPDVLFVAFGSPKQECFIHENLKVLNSNVVVGVGGSFDFISGKIKRAPEKIQKLGLEWLWRFAKEPKRAKRIFNAFPKFVSEIFKRV